MNIRNSLLIGIAACCSSMAFADTAYVSIKTSGQGQIVGSSSQKGHEKWIELLSVISPQVQTSGQGAGKVTFNQFSITRESWMSFEDEIVAPRDAASGLATGRRQHKPFTMCFSMDRAGQQLMQAFMGNEQITELTCCVIGDDGSVKTGVMTGVELSRVSFTKSDNGTPPTEEVSFTYRKIEWT
ncbi:MAG: type VI secretion system tube protein Hcp [Armatimonadota bacterium]